MGVRGLFDGAVYWRFVFAVRVRRRRRRLLCFTAAAASRRTKACGDLCCAERDHSRDSNFAVVAAVFDPNIWRMTVVSVPPRGSGWLNRLRISDCGMRIEDATTDKHGTTQIRKKSEIRNPKSKRPLLQVVLTTVLSVAKIPWHI